MRVDRGFASGRVLPYDWHRITVKFPRGKFQSFVEEASVPLLARFPNAKAAQKGLGLVTVHLRDDAEVTIDGFGIPFANPSDAELEGWVNDNKAIADGHTLLDILQQRKFFFLVAYPCREIGKKWVEDLLPPPLSYPYGTEHDWNVPRFKRLLQENKSPNAFQPAYR